MEINIKLLEGGVNVPKGFHATGISCGLKEGGYKDIGLILSDKPCTIAACFTKNRVKAAPVLLDIKRVNNQISAIVVNSGNANCLTGKKGEEDALKMASLVEEKLSLPEGSTLVASTGVIGQKLIMDRVQYGIEKICNLIKNENDYKNFSNAIMTTDKKMKNVAYEFEIDGTPVRIGGTAKGAGMIKPNLEIPHATMLVFITTDALISKEMLNRALKDAIEVSFNRISVDNDTSTNDSVFIMANGKAKNTKIDAEDNNYIIFREVLIKVCQSLAKMIVKDGEGVTKFIQIKVENALSLSDAEKIARAIADSYLVKTAIYGQNPNWGRILAAAGYSGAKFEPSHIKLLINNLIIFEKNEVNRANEGKLPAEMLSPEISITLDLGIGKKDFFIWTSDLSCDYVKINAHYIS